MIKFISISILHTLYKIELMVKIGWSIRCTNILLLIAG